MSRHRQKLANGIAKKAKDQAKRARNVNRAVVVRENPLVIELIHSELVLEEGEDFDMTRFVKSEKDDGLIKKNDVVLVMREAGDWTVFDVLDGGNG